MSVDFKPPWVDDPIAEVGFDCPTADDATVEVKVFVHRPRVKAEGYPYACGIEQHGLSFSGTLVPDEVTTTDIYGIDSWQALSLALQFANSGLVHASEKGVVFQWEGETLDMAGLFPWNTAALSKDRVIEEEQEP